MGQGDVYVQPDAPDPVLPDAIVLELTRARTELATTPVVDESGGEARAYLRVLEDTLRRGDVTWATLD